MEPVVRIVELHAENILGLRELHIDQIGDITTFCGPEGSGKTSALQILEVLFGGSRKDATILHHGSADGIVWCKLSSGHEIRRRVTETGAAEAQVLDPQFHKPISKPESWLKELRDVLGMDPWAFCDALPRQRIQMLLEAASVEASVAEIREAVEQTAEIVRGVDRPLDLQGLDGLIERTREERKACKAALEEAKRTVSGMSDTLQVEDDKADWRAEEKRIAALHMGLIESQALEVLEADQGAERECEALRHQLDQEISECREKYGFKKDVVQKASENIKNALRRQYAPDIDGLLKKSAIAREKGDKAAGVQKLAAMVEDMRKRADGLEVTWGSLDGSVKRLDALKEKLCASLDLDGVEIRGTDLYVRDGHGELVHFDRLNDARRARFAIRLATLRAGGKRVPFVCVDNLEAMSPTFRAAFLEEAQAAGVQFFCAYAADGDRLEINTST